MTSAIPHRLLFRGLCLLAALFLAFGMSAQKSKHKSKAEVKDSLKFYKKIKAFAYKRKLTKMAYDAVFVEPKPVEYPKEPSSKEEKIVNPYLKYQDKIVRNIRIKVYDPFGYSLTDTVPGKINRLERTGNRAHTTTRKWIIINKLLFKENEPLVPLELSETERILREAKYINDVSIFVTPSPTSMDSVDVNVTVIDKWPITIPFLVTDVFVNAKFRNYNLFGVGQTFEQFAEVRRPNLLDFYGSYSIDNIDNTYITATLYYRTNRDITQTSISFDRGFYSPLAKWAGGVYLSKAWSFYDYTDSIEGPKRSPSDYISYDVWGAKSFKLSKDTTMFNQSTSFILGGRYYATEYQRRPNADIDPGRTILNSYGVVGNVGFAIQQYYKDKYIYRFGANEDVPEGIIIQYIYGGLKIESKKIRYYSGVEVARAKRFKRIGYLSATFGYGMFFNQQVPNDVTFKYNLYYFSNLLKKGRWYFRQFLKYDYLFGENKISNERITITPDDLYGFSSGSLAGTTKMLLNSETVAYLPYNVIGFRLAPVITAGFGIIGSPEKHLVESNLYQAYTIGLMVRNENLLSSTFQVSFGMYPFFPDGGNYILKYNPIASFTLRVRNFTVSKPSFISY
jgi:hypothetical protein